MFKISRINAPLQQVNGKAVGGPGCRTAHQERLARSTAELAPTPGNWSTHLITSQMVCATAREWRPHQPVQS
jgi:hypothetical protein